MAIGEDIETSSSIEIDRHWIYLVQQDDITTFEVNEYFYINNTGETEYNGSLAVWIQNNSVIVADPCNDIPDMVIRYNAMGGGECFNLNETDNNDLYYGYPFLNENKLSYYRQREPLSITVFSTTNTSLNNDILHLNATIDGLSKSREEENFQGIGVHLTSENSDIGMLPVVTTHMPFNITTIENITLFNNGSDSEIISFSFSDLPQGWNAEIWNNTSKINNVSLAPQEYANLSLIITAPSNIASIYVRYTTQIDIEGNETKGLFTKQYLYETKEVTYEVYLLTIDELEVSSDLEMVHDELYWREEYGRYWFFARNEDVQPNTYTTMSMNLVITSEVQSNPYLLWALVFIIILIIVILLLKKIDFFKEKNILQKRDTSTEKRLNELDEQKKKVLSAIKRVECEFEDKTISKEDYERIRAAYKKRAIEILKEIDRLEK